MIPPYILTKKNLVAYHVRTKSPFCWGQATIELWDSTTYHGGDLVITSDYGDYHHFWTSIGDQSFLEFLLSVDKQYLLKKITSYNYMEFDGDATKKGMEKTIINYRKKKEIDKNTAHDAWHEIHNLVDFTAPSEVFRTEFMNNCSIMFEKVYDGCYELFDDAMEKRIQPQVEGFYTVIWPMLCDVWRKELANETVAAGKKKE